MQSVASALARRLSAPNEAGMSLEELDFVVSGIVAGIYERDDAAPRRRDPADGLSCCTVFNLALPVTRWLDYLRTCEGLLMGHRVRERLLARFIAEHLRLPAKPVFNRLPLSRNPFLHPAGPKIPASRPPAMGALLGGMIGWVRGIWAVVCGKYQDPGLH